MPRQRQDWEGRTPRWRCSLTQDRVERVIRCLQVRMFILKGAPVEKGDEELLIALKADTEYFQKVAEQFDKMLPDHEYPLLDEKWLDDAD